MQCIILINAYFHLRYRYAVNASATSVVQFIQLLPPLFRSVPFRSGFYTFPFGLGFVASLTVIRRVIHIYGKFKISVAILK